jgi:uncharacterized protein YuzE
MRDFEFSYDEENDDLFLFRKDVKSKGSIEFGNLVLDFDNKKNLVGIQIMEATEFICEITGCDKKLARNILVNLKKSQVEIKLHRNMIIFKIFLFSKFEEKMQIPITLPNITSPSPALIYT